MGIRLRKIVVFRNLMSKNVVWLQKSNHTTFSSHIIKYNFFCHHFFSNPSVEVRAVTLQGGVGVGAVRVARRSERDDWLPRPSDRDAGNGGEGGGASRPPRRPGDRAANRGQGHRGEHLLFLFCDYFHSAILRVAK